MRILDTFELRNLRAEYRQERRKLLKTAGQALSQLQAVATGPPVSHRPRDKEYSDPAVLLQIVQRAQEASRNVDTWRRKIYELEKKVAKARAAVLVGRIMLAVIVVIVAGYWLFHRG